MIIDGVFAHPIDTQIRRSTLECHETSHHYIKGHISVFSRGFICFCCLEPNFLHGVSCPYSPEYWRVSSVIPQKN